MIKKYFIALLLVNLVTFSPALAQGLSSENVGLVPTNPLYFLKEWGRGVRLFFTFNPISKAEMELGFGNAKAAEIKKVQELNPDNERAIKKALENYSESQTRLKVRLEILKETSANPRVDKLLDQLTINVVRHEKVLDEVAGKFDDKVEVQKIISKTKNKIEEAAASGADKDDPAKFISKLEQALVEGKKNDLEHARSVELIDRLSEKASKELKSSLSRLRRDFTDKLDDDIKIIFDEGGGARVESAVAALPGNAARHAVILEEVRLRTANPKIASALSKASGALEEETKDEKVIALKAEEQIKRAEEVSKKLEERYLATPEILTDIKRVLAESQERIQRAKKAYQENQYGEALGQARSAEVFVRNALRRLEDVSRPRAEDLEQTLEELAAKIAKYEQLLKARGFSPENNPKAYALLADAQKHLGFARDAFANNDLEGAKEHVGHVKGYLHDLSRLFEGERRPATVSPAPAAVSPTGLRSDSQSERCEVIQKEMRNLKPRLISGELTKEQYKEKLDNLQKEREKICAQAVPQSAPVAPKTPLKRVAPSHAPTPTPSLRQETICTQEYNPICGSDGKTYPNECHAKVAGVAVKYRGQCEQVRKEEPAAVAPTPQPVEQKSATEPTTVSPTVYEYKIEADDNGFYPASVISVPKGSKVKIHFIVRTTNVYFGGLRFTSSKFRTGSVKPGESATVEFVADESFAFQSWWPLQDVLKATGKISIQ